ncbi:ABC transporter ATP-binding protein [Butyrivibrio sp. INlla14]|uniref:ABC transporter ATP-binding protein n=1 Tax=Butyrivibrio sp. INlla14 TaxID=1520808 RepID=UPI000876DEDC|nr:ABC transporter ATP-binding protein [Butyrivibrio sp. INlla14]SCY73159.1 Wzt C-terminal domain-containing protein [Butyrivibrio sp. INlla14]
MSETVIKIEGLKKQYRLGTIGGGTLTADLQSWWARKRGKEDPNTEIGTDMSKVGETFYALNGINLEVHKGEALGIIGANGAGKSTLLKLLCRVTAPSEGTIKMSGRIASMLEVGTGFHPELTGRENIYMNGAILGMTRAEIDSKIEEIIDFSECRQFIDTPVKRYSSGMYVKLAFAVAAHLDAEIMIMDEVLAVGDVKFQQKCLGKMGNAASNEGKTVLYVSHNMSTIRQLCNRCIVLEHGKIVFDGDVDKAIAVYLGIQKGEFKSHYLFSDTVRPSLEHGGKIFAEELRFLNNSTYFVQNEPVEVEVKWKANEEVRRVGILFMICTLDDKTIGFFQSDKLIDNRAGKEYSVKVQMDISSLMEGDYYTYLDIISLNEFGTHVGLDRPVEKIFFSVRRSKEYDGIIWNNNALGHVEFPRIETVNCREM